VDSATHVGYFHSYGGLQMIRALPDGLIRQGKDRGRRVLEVLLGLFVVLIACLLVWRIRSAMERPSTQTPPASALRSPAKERPVLTESPLDAADPPASTSAVGLLPMELLPPPPDGPHNDRVAEGTAQPGGDPNVSQTPPDPREDHGPPSDAAPSDIVRIRSLSTADVPTPLYSLSDESDRPGRPGLWHVITVEYESRPTTIGRLSFTYWAMMGGERDGSGGVVSSRRVTYLDVGRGPHHSVMYLSPNTFARFGPARKIAVSVSSAGRELAYATLAGDQDHSWLTPSGPSRLFSRQRTPFWLIDYDLYDSEASPTNTAGLSTDLRK